MADRVAVMYAGKIVETGTAEDIFYRPKHPYTQALLKSLPTVETSREEKLVSIAGTPPDLFMPPKGCEFASRCEHCMKVCKKHVPPTYEVGAGPRRPAGGCTPPARCKGRRELRMAEQNREKLISLENVCKYFNVGHGKTLKAVDGITLDIYRGETLGVVGESGCGKSTLGRVVMGIYQPHLRQAGI